MFLFMVSNRLAALRSLLACEFDGYHVNYRLNGKALQLNMST